MTRVTGIGGVFFKAKDPAALGQWYRRHLGLPIEEWGGMAFRWQTPGRTEPDGGVTIWTIFKAESSYYPGPFMINYRVDDLDALVATLREEGCAVDEKTETSEYGKFGWVTDPEGNRIELWQPPKGEVSG